MKRRKTTNAKTVYLFIIVPLFIVFVAGCTRPEPYKYDGKYPELYSIAINSVLGATGYWLSEVKFNPEISILDEDQYGRKLFLYCEYKGISTYSLIVSQKDNGQYAWFYPDFNFISAPDNSFSEEEIDTLKIRNDWGKEIDTEKCSQVEIVYLKDKGPVSNGRLMQLYFKALRKDARRIENIGFFTVDDYGRSMYLGYGTGGQYVVMLFNPDGSYDENKCLMELTDWFNYQDDLKAFKERNGWNKPYQ